MLLKDFLSVVTDWPQASLADKLDVLYKLLLDCKGLPQSSEICRDVEVLINRHILTECCNCPQFLCVQ